MIWAPFTEPPIMLNVRVNPIQILSPLGPFTQSLCKYVAITDENTAFDGGEITSFRVINYFLRATDSRPSEQC
ncbi:hypothetical protein ACFFQF_17855 [Haladaptatus pallidirubidus]|uniref:Uncharacterized protein n=1 Tax=Haladaptatus pallidirubidus TaxID=1008152 RepID=A0AAV3UR81_9EURY